MTEKEESIRLLTGLLENLIEELPESRRSLQDLLYWLDTIASYPESSVLVPKHLALLMSEIQAWKAVADVLRRVRAGAG